MTDRITETGKLLNWSSKAKPAPAPKSKPAGDIAALSATGRAQEMRAEQRLLVLASATRKPETTWTANRPLSEAKNAHSTNTKEHLEEALKHGYNFLEGDIRTEINPPYELEMRHDKGHESGDNLTLREWLEIGKVSGRGLKLDVKEGDRLADILDLVEQVGVPDEQLMFNLGDGDMAQWGAEIRRRFPGATLAINPLGSGDTLSRAEVDRMLALAEEFGSPVTFVVRYDRLSDEAIARLTEQGPVSIWNDPGRGGVDDIEALTRELRERGVDGVIDLRPSKDAVDKAKDLLDKGKNLMRLDRYF